MRQPDVTADHAVIPDNSLTAENRRPGINHYTVADVRMALDALDKRPVFPDFKTLCAERDMLVQLHVIADRRRLSDDDTGSVVNKEVTADGGTGMNVDTRDPVGVLRHHARDKRNLHLV